MKLLVLIVILLSSIPCAAQKNAPTEPTLKETLQWLKENIALDASFTVTGADGRDTALTFTVEPREFETCNISWGASILISHIPSTYHRISFSLTDINPTSVTATKPDGKLVWSVSYATIHAKEVIQMQIGSRPDTIERVKALSSDTLPVKDQETAQQFAKALARAATLCGHTPKLF